MSFLAKGSYRAESARKKLETPKGVLSRVHWRFFAILGAICALSFVVYLIAFAGLPKVLPPLIVGKAVPAQIVSSLDFSYDSEILTQARKNQVTESVSPSYKINESVYKNAEAAIDRLEEFLMERQQEFDKLGDAEKKSQALLEGYSSEIKKASGVSISPEDVYAMLKDITPASREEIFNQVQFRYKSILADGVYENSDAVFSEKGDWESTYTIEGANSRAKRIRSEREAIDELKRRILSIGSVNAELSYVFFRIFNQEIRPNIAFDEHKTAARKNEAREKVQPVIVKVREGEVIIESGDSSVTNLTKEKYSAYRKEMLSKYSSEKNTYADAFNNFFCVFFLVCGATLFIIISRTRTNKRKKTLGIFATLLLFNLTLERLIIQMCNAEIFKNGETLLHLLTYATPLVLGPVMMVLLFSSYTGFVMSLLLSVLATLMFSQGVEFFLLLFVSSLFAIYFCDGAKTRSRVIFGGFIYGLILAVAAVVMGVLNGAYYFPLQAALAVISGLTSGIVATVMLPVLEKIFKTSSNITLLELTDFNNPLLNKLQIVASGSYHHSVMVAHLAEHAASQVHGANPLKCRVGALYHDIGKIIKPEFFSENQSGGRNPHDDQSPSMSALIIKSHIKEGRELALLAKMPRPVLDAIEEHHGTSIIAYFYNKAMAMAGAANSPDPMSALRDAGIDESTYRHDGRKPQSIETAIILLADSCEAASRSLRRVTPHGVEELVDKIVKQKMNDGQLDEAPVTVQQLTRIKKSFVFTMLNKLHSRVEYNNEPKKEHRQ